MVGGIGLKPDKEDQSVEWINGFALNSSLRGMGIGQRLFQLVLDNARATTKTLRLMTLDRLKAALAIYKKNGFQIVDSYVEDDDWTVLTLEKFINK
jgi:GNAT superfamily N-acetyltransferase